jgi:hypothetical protein
MRILHIQSSPNPLVKCNFLFQTRIFFVQQVPTRPHHPHERDKQAFRSPAKTNAPKHKAYRMRDDSPAPAIYCFGKFGMNLGLLLLPCNGVWRRARGALQVRMYIRSTCVYIRTYIHTIEYDRPEPSRDWNGHSARELLTACHPSVFGSSRAGKSRGIRRRVAVETFQASSSVPGDG